MLEKLFGDPNRRYLRRIQPMVEEVNKLEKKFESFSNKELRQKTEEFKKRINPEGKPLASYGARKGETLDDILPEAFALVREAAKRTLNQRHFDVQIMGGIVLHQGKIAEMKTGEGKTLAATLPLYLNGLTGNGVHLVTVNDYLARRDTVWMGQIYYTLGLSVGCINHEAAYLYDPEYKGEEGGRDKVRDELGGFKVVEDYLKPISRKEAYQADILYGTNNEFGFDYLRDNMAYDKNDLVQSDLSAGRQGFHYAIVDEVDSILIDEARTPLIISAPDVESAKLYQQFARITPQLKKDIDYKLDEKTQVPNLTEEGQNKIVKILGRDPWAESDLITIHHLTQALRAFDPFTRDKDYVVKNGEVIIVDEFTGRLMPGRRYSGGLHQAIEAKERVDVQKESKTLATITFQNFFRMYKKLAGMTGTALTNAEEFDKVYKLEVIIVPTNKPMIREDLSDLVYKTEAGKFKAVVERIKECYKNGQPVLVGTVSIEKNELLGNLLKREGIHCNILNAKNHEKEGEIIAQAGKSKAVTVATNMAGRGVDIVLGGNPSSPEGARGVKEAGGLYVIGTERHEARRIDNQLRGRSGRQGDSGVSQFFVSLEDELMIRFGSDKIKNLMTALKVPEDMPIQNKLISNAIGKAQARIEGYNFDIRHHLLEYDEVMNKQRQAVYKMRKDILWANDEKIEEKIRELMDEKELNQYKEKIEKLGEDFKKATKFIMLRAIDIFWMEHLETMECLRESVSLRAYGQRDPLVEYKNEGRRLFDLLLQNIDNAIVDMLLKVELKQQAGSSMQVTENKKPAFIPTKSGLRRGKIGRNDPCPCGSGLKYKKCCGS